MFFREIKEIRKTKPTAWEYLNSTVMDTPGLESQSEILILLRDLLNEVECLMTEDEKSEATKRFERIKSLFGEYPTEFLLESQMLFKKCIEIQFNKPLF